MSENQVCLSLVVDDYEKGIHFYRDTTKLFKLVANTKLGPVHRYVFLAYNHPEISFGLVLTLATSDSLRMLVGRQGGEYAFFVLPVEDCWSTYTSLQQAGVPFDGDPLDLPYGYQTTMIDPFGNKVCLSQSFNLNQAW